jgi:mannose-6-phosphate isomerase-like protein (cupin superfamily)
VPEAQLEDSGSGLTPASDGWFVVNVRDSLLTSETRGSAGVFHGRDYSFPQFGINLRVLQPGRPNALYHSESEQEAFLVLFGECRLLVEGKERLLRPWDFFHCPAGTEHVLVGAGRRAVRDRGGRDLRSGTGVCRVGGTAAGASVVLERPPLGLARCRGRRARSAAQCRCPSSRRRRWLHPR